MNNNSNSLIFKKTIVLIVDEINLRKSLAFTLKKNEFTVKIAMKEVDVITTILELCKKYNSMDLIIIDLQLSDFIGKDLVTKFKENSICTPILIITAHWMQHIFEELKLVGSFDFMRKPFDVKELINRVVQLIDK